MVRRGLVERRGPVDEEAFVRGIVALLVCLCLLGCPPKKPVETSPDASGNPGDLADRANQDLGRGHYAAAIQSARSCLTIESWNLDCQRVLGLALYEEAIASQPLNYGRLGIALGKLEEYQLGQVRLKRPVDAAVTRAMEHLEVLLARNPMGRMRPGAAFGFSGTGGATFGLSSDAGGPQPLAGLGLRFSVGFLGQKLRLRLHAAGDFRLHGTASWLVVQPAGGLDLGLPLGRGGGGLLVRVEGGATAASPAWLGSLRFGLGGYALPSDAVELRFFPELEVHPAVEALSVSFRVEALVPLRPAVARR